jgi:hypothetical protein
MLYSYLALLTAAMLGYKGVAPLLAIAAVGGALSLPFIARERGTTTLSLTNALSAANALAFAATSYGAGRGIAWMLGT